MQDRRTRALGYVARARDEDGRYQAEVAALERGCSELGLTLVGVVSGDAAGDVPADVDFVVVTELDRDGRMERTLDGLVHRAAPLVVVPRLPERRFERAVDREADDV